MWLYTLIPKCKNDRWLKKKNVTVPKPDTQEQLLTNSKLQGWSMYIKLQQDDIYIYAFMNRATAITFCFIF